MRRRSGRVRGYVGGEHFGVSFPLGMRLSTALIIVGLALLGGCLSGDLWIFG